MGFGLAYAALLAAMDPSPQALPWTGGLLGLAHGMLVGVALGPLGALHPRAGPRASGCGELVRPPGLFGRHYGPMTPISLLAAHVLYAAVTVTLYSWLISGPVR
jgi:hypothetical protein